ncbi:MAG: hypothetical protein CMK02_04780 [Polycyclovorans sp.]|nr:hypothetical protein [Polycyclovorans sp.]
MISPLYFQPHKRVPPLNVNASGAISGPYEDAFEALYPPDQAALKRTRAYALRALRQHLSSMPGTQQQIADQLGIQQPRLNLLLRGDSASISLDNMVKLAARAGLRAELILKPTSSRRRT